MHIIAHRGFNGRYPEMSPLAYEKALTLPIHGVECDVRLTHDGQVVCTHDRTMERVAGDPMVVSQATVGQLKKLNIAQTFAPNPEAPASSRYPASHPPAGLPPAGQPLVQHLLTLDELLDMVFATDDKHLYIETKHPSRAGRMLEEQLVLRLRYHNLLQSRRIHVISFSHVAMRRMRALAPKIETFYLRRDWEARVNPKDVRLSASKGLGLSVVRGHSSPSLITDNTYMWTVNKPADMVWARDHGISVMATDFPDVALDVVGSGKL